VKRGSPAKTGSACVIGLFLARRYLLASRREAQAGVVALAAFLGLALGVAALVISVALLAGFQST